MVARSCFRSRAPPGPKFWERPEGAAKGPKEQSVGDIEKVKFVPRACVGDRLRLLPRRKRVTLHLPRWEGPGEVGCDCCWA